MRSKATEALQKYYKMMYPAKLREDEYIRLVALHTNQDGSTERFVRYVRSYEEYASFVKKYRFLYDLFGQASTNHGNTDGTAGSQWRRRVLFLDFDKKDHPDITSVKACMEQLHAKLPRLYVHCIVDSGHGYHCYVCIPQTDNVAEVVQINKQVAEITGADPRAVSPTQLCRIPCSYNHKTEHGADYANKQRWQFVSVVNNTFGNTSFHALDLHYIGRMCGEYQREAEIQEVLEKVEWHYEELSEAPRYLCIRRALQEGADKGQRNFWHGRIVAMLEMEGCTPAAIRSACQEYNKKCRPPKHPSEIDKDTDRFLNGDYKLLGCYESFSADDPRRQWVYDMCDKVHCGTYHAGTTVTIKGSKPARINRKALGNKDLRELSGIHFLVLTLMDVYADTYGRRGFRESDLEKLLHSSVAKRQCVSHRHLKEILSELEQRRYIEIIPDRKSPNVYGASKLKLARRLKEFQKGYIWFFFSIANALIDGKISQTDYRVFLALARNLQSDRKAVTYEQLADDLDMDPQNVGKSIRKLRDERCIIVRKRMTESGYEYNQYTFTDPKIFAARQDEAEEVISLLA